MPGGRIIVAEDDAQQARILKLYLEREGYAVFVVRDGLQALDAIRQRRPDLVLLDVMMPGLDGLDVCRVIRDESDVPIIMITARAGEDDFLRGLDLGADDYITKPYGPRDTPARAGDGTRTGGTIARPGDVAAVISVLGAYCSLAWAAPASDDDGPAHAERSQRRDDPPLTMHLLRFKSPRAHSLCTSSLALGVSIYAHIKPVNATDRSSPAGRGERLEP